MGLLKMLDMTKKQLLPESRALLVTEDGHDPSTLFMTGGQSLEKSSSLKMSVIARQSPAICRREVQHSALLGKYRHKPMPYADTHTIKAWPTRCITLPYTERGQ